MYQTLQQIAKNKDENKSSWGIFKYQNHILLKIPPNWNVGSLLFEDKFA